MRVFAKILPDKLFSKTLKTFDQIDFQQGGRVFYILHFSTRLAVFDLFVLVTRAHITHHSSFFITSLGKVKFGKVSTIHYCYSRHCHQKTRQTDASNFSCLTPREGEHLRVRPLKTSYADKNSVLLHTHASRHLPGTCLCNFQV